MNSTINVVGNLVANPKLITGAGKPRSIFSIAVQEGKDETKKVHFLNFTAFGVLAENVAASLAKGQRIVVSGHVDTYAKVVTVDGEEKTLTMVSFVADNIGPDLRWATAAVTRIEAPDTGVSADSAAKPAAKTTATKTAAVADDPDF